MLAVAPGIAGFLAGSAGTHAHQMLSAGHTMFAVVWLIVTLGMVTVAVLIVVLQWTRAL